MKSSEKYDSERLKLLSNVVTYVMSLSFKFLMSFACCVSIIFDARTITCLTKDLAKDLRSFDSHRSDSENDFLILTGFSDLFFLFKIDSSEKTSLFNDISLMS